MATGALTSATTNQISTSEQTRVYKKARIFSGLFLLFVIIH